MPDQVSTFESHRAQVCLFLPPPQKFPVSYQHAQLASSLVAVADSMRNCAQMADTFAKVVSDSTYSPETAEILQGMPYNVLGDLGRVSKLRFDT